MSSEPRRQGGLVYRPALDGLRAISVGAVLAYHLGYDWAPGGFMGVDVFFVLSGFLITSLLLGEREATGHIDLRAFWGRRARRLLPAIFLVLLALAASTLLPGSPIDLARFRGDSLATLLYVQNWWLIFQGETYFDLYGSPSPLRHAWSLAIEEQFYIVWPILVAAILRRKLGGSRLLGCLSVVACLASAAWMALAYDPVDASRAYFGTATRMHTLLVGALCAVCLHGRDEALRRWRVPLDAAGAFGLAVCVAGFAWLGDDDSFFYHGGSLLFALAACLVVVAAAQRDRMPFQSVLALRPLRALGRISYGIYLWHWPVIVLMTRSRTGLEGHALASLQVASTLVLSWASYVLIESPVRHGVLRARVTPIHGLGAAAGLLVILLVATTGPSEAPADGLERAGDMDSAPAVVRPDGPPIIGIVGDSVAGSLAEGVTAVAKPLGYRVVDYSIDGCGFAVRYAVRRTGVPFNWTESCGERIDRRVELLLTHRPTLVLWLSSWDFADQLIDGRHVRFGTPEGDRVLLESMEDLLGRFRSQGIPVAILIPAERAASDRAEAATDPDGYLARYQGLLRRFAEEHPEDVTLVDLAALICPEGPPCPERIVGRVIRPDGGHFSPEGGAWVTRLLLRPLFLKDALTTRRRARSSP